MAVGLDLDQYHLRKRVLLVFAPQPGDVRYKEQMLHLEDEDEEVEDWEIVVFRIFEEGPSFAEERPLSREESRRARETFGVEEGAFGIHLLDLDGNEILSSEEPIPVDLIVDAIHVE
jgi:hypothetical protein